MDTKTTGKLLFLGLTKPIIFSPCTIQCTKKKSQTSPASFSFSNVGIQVNNNLINMLPVKKSLLCYSNCAVMMNEDNVKLKKRVLREASRPGFAFPTQLVKVTPQKSLDFCQSRFLIESQKSLGWKRPRDHRDQPST